MRWKRTALLNVMLVVATSALHLTVEQGINNDQISTSPATIDETPNSVLVHTIQHSEDFAVGDETINAVTDNTTKEKPTTTQSNSYSNSDSVAYADEPIGHKEKRMNTESLHDRKSDEKENENNGGGDDEGGTEGGNGDDTNDDTFVVETTSGRVRGHFWRENEKIISYIDIKYGTFDSPFEV